MLDFFARKKETTKEDVQNEVFLCLENKDFISAIKKVGDFEAKQPFPRWIWIDWKNYSKSMYSSDLEVLNLIFNSKPLVLKNIEWLLYQKVRLWSALSYLWWSSSATQYFSKEDVSEFKNSNIDFEKLCRLLFFYSKDVYDKKNWSESGFVKSVEILWGGKSCCDYCKEMNGKIFKIDEVPELPFEKCSSVNWCKCSLLAVMD